MVSTPPSRHWITAILIQIGLRIRFWYSSWLGLKPLLTTNNAYRSPFRPPKCPIYDTTTLLGFKFIWFFIAASREYYFIPYIVLLKSGLIHLFVMAHEWLSKRLMKQFEDAGYMAGQNEVAIPEYDWVNGNPEEFYNTFVAKPHPVVLRGFMNNTSLLSELSWDNVIRNYSNENVFLTKKELDGFPGKLKEVDNPSVYLHNSEILFTKYPEIRKHFQYEKLEPYLKMKVGYEQLFIGREGTGSPFHHAAVYNMFYMIDGKKKWWFIDPYDSILAYPLNFFGRAAGILFCLWPGEYNEAAFPLFPYCPVYSTVLNPGDVLFNPPWWWHSIKNITPTSTACATRWHTDGICGQNFTSTEEDYDIDRISSLFFLAGWSSWPFLHGVLQTPSPRFDEHLTLRETKNRYVHNQIKMSEDGGVKAMGITVKF
eukprot:gene14314-19198_t